MENFTSFEIPKPVDDNGKIQKKDSTYTTSLFKRSKIIKIIRFNALSFKPMFTGRNTPIHIDLMIVSNSVSLPDVIQKFDLSCCKVFFDGDWRRVAEKDGGRRSKGARLHCLPEGATVH
jgi:hypothetical protein